MYRSMNLYPKKAFILITFRSPSDTASILNIPRIDTTSIFKNARIDAGSEPEIVIKLIENYFFNIASLRRKERIARTNYITRRSNFLFKLKPGYLVYWRSYRKSFKSIAYLTYYRQRRLTNYFLNFKKANSLMLLRNFEFSIFSIVKRSSFFLDYTITLLCFRLGMVYLNGNKILDQNVQVYIGDRVQISISPINLIIFP